MMHVFINATGASAGSGLTYLCNVVPRMALLPELCVTLAVQPQLQAEFSQFGNVNVLDVSIPENSVRRFWFEQKKLPQLIRGLRADVLLSTGNFAVHKSPVPQILLSGNSLYTSADFYRDLRRRYEYRLWVDTKLRGIFARRSIHWADCTVAPSRAFAAELQRWTGRQILPIHHGFDAGVFFGDESPLAGQVTQKLTEAVDCLKLLFVSHYNYYRNFETLFRALALLRNKAPDRKVRLFLTCTFDDRKTPGAYKTSAAAGLVSELGLREQVVELGAVPYRQLHHIYRACDVYVTPAYAETFAHPLVEAMACGLPVIASDIPAHREICSAASFFERFSADQLAQRLLEAPRSIKTKNAVSGAVQFSWSEHVSKLLAVASRLTGGPQEDKSENGREVVQREPSLHPVL